MEKFIRKMELRWADLDPNFHLRHSVYYDYGATARIDFLQQHGITAQFMLQHSFGPVILREECVFKKEIRPDDQITIDIELRKATPDCSRWTIQHTIFKNGDIVSALLTIDGAWIDINKRKLTVPPAEVVNIFGAMPGNHNPFPVLQQ